MISEAKENVRQNLKRIRNNKCGGGGKMLSPLCLGGSYMEMIKEMSIDLETYSDIDIKKSGAY